MGSPAYAAEEILFEPMFALPHRTLFGLRARPPFLPENPVLRTILDNTGQPAIEAVLGLMAGWRDVAPALRTTVPVCTADLAKRDFLNRLESAVKASGIRWESIDIGVDAPTLATDVETLKRNLKALRRRDVTLTVLGYGTGFTSLRLLSVVPLTGLEMHHQYTSDIAQEDRLVLESHVALGHDMKFDVRAESVPSLEHLATLADIGVSVARGPALAEAMPAAAVRRWLLEHQRS